MASKSSLIARQLRLQQLVDDIRDCTKTSQETSPCCSEKFMDLLYEIKKQKKPLIAQGIEYSCQESGNLFQKV